MAKPVMTSQEYEESLVEVGEEASMDATCIVREIGTKLICEEQTEEGYQPNQHIFYFATPELREEW